LSGEILSTEIQSFMHYDITTVSTPGLWTFPYRFQYVCYVLFVTFEYSTDCISYTVFAFNF